jgi:L-ascorbate metabolism protein UlaG (beta-lactamase superfamily)
MKIKWYGHSAFLITSDQGVKIITDPYESGAYGGQLSYGKIRDQADIALTSHDHADHNDTKSLPGSPEIVKGSKTAKGISFKGISTYHDPSKGSERGANTIFTFSFDGIQVCHLGDLGHIQQTFSSSLWVDTLLLTRMKRPVSPNRSNPKSSFLCITKQRNVDSPSPLSKTF